MPLRLGGNATAIKNTKVNTESNYSGGTNINKVVINGNVKWEKVTASFGGLTGASPTSYNNQIVIAYEDNVTSPGSPTKTGYDFITWDPALPTTISVDTTFTAQWTPIEYTITYNLGGGFNHASNPNTYTIEDTPITLLNPSRSLTGYIVTFDGWYLDAELTNQVTGISAGSTGNKEFFAKWTTVPITYYVAFNKNNDAATGTMTNQTFTYNTAQNLNANAFSLSNYNFTGWATSAGGSVVYTDGQSVSNLSSTSGATVTLYAKWTEKMYTLSFEENGGTTVQDITITYGDGIIKPTDPTKTGYIFDKWYNEPGLTTAVVWPLFLTADKTIYAGWTPIAYSVAFDKNDVGASGTMSNQSFTYGIAQNLTSEGFTDPTGKYFLGWATSSGGAVVYTNGQSVSNLTTTNGATVTLYAKWATESYNIVYDENGGTGVLDVTLSYGASITLPSPTKTGYTFGGWWSSETNNNGSGTQITWTTVPDLGAHNSTTTLYAKWNLVTYTISYTLNGGTNNASNPSSYNIESSTITFLNPTRTGYQFNSWSLTSIPAGSTGNKSTTASWTANTYTVAYNGNGSTSGSTTSSSHTYDTANNLTTNGFSRTGYTFAGWATSAGGSVVYTDGQSVSNLSSTNGATVTLYAKWTANAYYVLLSPTAGAVVAVDAIYDSPMPNGGYDINTNPALVSAPILTGYTFAGYWQNDNKGGTKFYNNNMTSANNWNIASDTTISAGWDIESYTINFVENGGTNVTNITQNYGTTLTPPPNPTRTGYTFGGWYNDSELTSSFSWPATMPDYGDNGATKNIYAKWNIESYTYNFIENGGTAVTNISANYGTSLTSFDTTTTRTGYTFVNWYEESNFVTVWTRPSTMPDLGANGTTKNIYASWTPNEYTVTLNQQSGSGGTTSVTATYDAAMPAATAPSRTGYTFGGYYTSTGGAGTEYYTSSMGSARNWDQAVDTTLYAKWNIITYTISYTLNGGTNNASNPSSYNIESSTITFLNPTRTGYQFAGWSLASIPAGSTGNKSTTASWTANTYTVVFNANTGSGTMADQPFTYGVSQVLTSNTFTRTGYQFAGWATSAGGSVVYSDGQSVSNLTTTNEGIVTLYAKWTANTYIVAFNANTGSGTMADQPFTYDVSQSLRTNTFTKTGYTFAGWATSAGGSVVYTDGQSVSNLTSTNNGTVTLYAKWSPKEFVVSFNENGGDTPSPLSKTVIYDSNYGTLATVSRVGYTFNGWFTESSGGSEITSTTTVSITSNQILYAQWTIESYTIDFDENGGSPVTNITANYGASISLPNSTRTGYTFSGWWSSETNNNGSGTQRTWTTMPDLGSNGATVTIYAQWTPNPFNITLNANGGTAGTDTTIAVVYNTSIDSWTADHMPSRTGYTFNGYYTATSGGTQRISSDGTYVALTSTTYSSAATLYAQWTAKSFDITLNATTNGGTNASNRYISVTYATSIEAFNINMIPYRAGYTFNGYYTLSSGGTQRISPTGYVSLTSTTYSSATTLYAQFTYAVGLSPALISVGAQNNANWILRSYNANAYLGQQVRLVLKYTSGSTYTGDAQFDDFSICGTFYDPESGVNSFKRNNDDGSTNTTYSSVVWEDLTTDEVAGKFGRDSGGTATSYTGLSAGKTGSFYYYAETSGSGAGGKTFWLRSPYVTATSGTLSFYSAQYGETCGPFEAYLEVRLPLVAPSVPNIIDYSCYSVEDNIHITWKVTNNDPTQTVTIYSAVNNSTPEIGGLVRTNIAPGGTTTTFDVGNFTIGGSVTVYAKAGVDEVLSSYDAQVVSKDLCFSL